MQRIFTRLFSVALVMAFMLTAGLAAKAQQTTLASVTTLNKKADAKSDSAATVANDTKTIAKPVKKADDTWVPVRRLWGYAFGDLYFNQHADGANRGPETQYNGTPANRNAFQFRRLYLGYDYDISKKFSAEVLLASEPNANTGGVTATSGTIQNGDNLVDGKMAFWIKNFNIRVRDLWKGTDLVVGEMSTPGFALNTGNSNAPTSLSEATWGYRFIEKTITDFHKNNSYDVGAALQGTFDPSTKNFGYVLMVGNNSQSNLLAASNPATGFYKIFYGDLWGKFLDKKLYVDIYAHYVQTGPSTATIGEQAQNMEKIFVAYNTKPITVGVEIYTQMFKNGVTSAAHGTQNANALGMSFWAKGNITDKWGWFGRYDNYNPYTNFDSAVPSYTANTTYGNYTPLYKETFVTAGLDFQPFPKIHFSPNVWLVQFKDQRSASTAGYVGDGHDLVYRATFYYTFGK